MKNTQTYTKGGGKTRELLMIGRKKGEILVMIDTQNNPNHVRWVTQNNASQKVV